MIVGFQPDAPAGKLYIDPVLPEWLPDLTIRDLQVGQDAFDLRFWRDEGCRLEGGWNCLTRLRAA
jgi:hypothetical protein